jgi:hypothetical protein
MNIALSIKTFRNGFVSYLINYFKHIFDKFESFYNCECYI